ncbi:MAG: serine hydrolase [Actinobacteria bacterium]|nr:serine hydrolase [Actinomycetota bacterium]
MQAAQVVSRRAVLAGTASVLIGGMTACQGDRRDGTANTSPTVTDESTTVLQPTTASTTASTTTSTTTSTTAATTAPSGTSTYFPPADGEWETLSPSAAGFTDGGIADVLELVGETYGQSFIMLFEGRIVAEQYWQGATATTVRDVASAQKSITSTLLGLARDRGLLAFDDTVTSYLGVGWSAAAPSDEALITLLHLMTMSSGLSPTNLRKVAAPGTVWDYNTDAYQKLRRVLEVAAATDINSISNDWLFATIGLSTGSSWVDRAGVVDAVGDHQWGLRLTAREMARYGLFAARNGFWDGAQVTEPAWFAQAWTATSLKRDYGYLWWLLGRGRLGNKGAPADLVAALGAQDQKIYVSVSTGLVVARQGDAAKEDSANESDFDGLLLKAISRARA